MLLRWLFLFALLLNAIVLFWYSIQVPDQQKSRVAVHGNQLRLVSEMDSALLVRKDINQEQWCSEFGGLDSEIKAEALVSFILEQGFHASYRSDYYLAIKEYAVVITIPADLEKQLAVMDLIELHEKRSLSEDELGFEYRLGGFADRKTALSVIKRLAEQSVKSDLKAIRVTQKQYVVTIVEQGDRNLSKEIKEVVQERYSLVKNEKKLCEGVAKP